MKTKINKLFLSLILGASFTVANFANAASVYTSNQSGNWPNSIWTQTGTGGSPVTYIISAGHTITMNANVSGIDTLYIYGILNLGNNRELTMNVGGVIILNNTGVITGGNVNTKIRFGASTSTYISGPFTGGNQIDNGPRYGNYGTMMSANGDPQGSFPITLPVELKSITINNSSDEFILNWTALGESNLNSFEVQISSNGRTYSTLGIVKGNLEISEGHYAFNLGHQTNSFYVRLSEIQQSEKNVLTTKYQKVNTLIADNFQLYPTVIGATTTKINMVVPMSGDYKVAVFNTSMQEVCSGNIVTGTDNQLEQIDIASIQNKPGTYFTVVTGQNGQVYKTKILVQ